MTASFAATARPGQLNTSRDMKIQLSDTTTPPGVVGLGSYSKTIVLPSNTSVPRPGALEYLGSFRNTLSKPEDELSGASLARLQLRNNHQYLGLEET